jgi:hypothetical protein
VRRSAAVAARCSLYPVIGLGFLVLGLRFFIERHNRVAELSYAQSNNQSRKSLVRPLWRARYFQHPFRHSAGLVSTIQLFVRLAERIFGCAGNARPLPIGASHSGGSEEVGLYAGGPAVVEYICVVGPGGGAGCPCV